MERREVKSSTIQVIGFSAEQKLLEVTFNSGATYRYSGVPKEIADAFLNAESKGSYFSVSIRACYPCERVHLETCGRYLECHVPLCECFCHRLTKGITNDREIPNPNLAPALKKSIKAVKAKKRIS